MCRLHHSILIATVLIFGMAMQAEAKPSATGRAKATPAAVASPQPAPSPEPPFVAHRDPLDARCYRETDHDRADLCAQWRAALAAESAAWNSHQANIIAMVSTAVGLFGIIGLLITLRLTRTANALSRRAAEAAEKTMLDSRQIGEAQSRCYLSIEAVRAYISEADGRPRLLVSIRNSGASPALETTWMASMGYTPTGSEGTRRDEPRSADLIRAAIAPGRVFDVPAVELNFPIEPAERAHVLRDGEWLQLSARLSVTANDVFGKSVVTEDFFTGAIHDLDVWFALEATGAQPVRTVSADGAAARQASSDADG